MSFFDDLLAKRDLAEPLLPLWRLKVTDEEFERLRQLLEACTHIETENPFMSVCKTATLFFAEYWRREYTIGHHSVQMVYDALKTTGNREALCEAFYNAACCGARRLGVETYDGGRAMHLQDMLYQGGLPMQLVTANANNPNTVWGRFARGLINRRIEFQELNLGAAAATSSSLRAYCEQLIAGIESEDPSGMPFYCTGKDNPWYQSLISLAQEERRHRREQDPFSVSWEFAVDSIERKIFAKYVFEGQRSLSQGFLENRGLSDASSFSVQVRRNGAVVDTFEYRRNFCRFMVRTKNTCAEGDSISIYLSNQEEPYKVDSLDMSIPHTLSLISDDKYELGNDVGHRVSLLLIPEGWSAEDGHGLSTDTYHWGETSLSVIHIPTDFEQEVVVSGTDGQITFGRETCLYWTGITSRPLLVSDVKEPVYDAKTCRFALMSDAGERGQRTSRQVEYRSKWGNRWTAEPPYGEIYARAIDSDHFVTPVQLLNIGREDDLDISVLAADNESCRIRVHWKHGSAHTLDGEREAGQQDVWTIRKERCRRPGSIIFTFTPHGNARNQFSLSLNPPFRDFFIFNVNSPGDRMENNCYVPFSDIDSYRYHLVGHNVTYRYGGGITRRLCWSDDDHRVAVRQGGTRLREVPYEGSLAMLYDSREALRSLLDRTSKDITEAKVKVSFTYDNNRTMTITIMEFPFCARHIENARVVITDKNQQPVRFSNKLLLLPLNNLPDNPIEIQQDEEPSYYLLPQEIRPWGKTLLFGSATGRILPQCVDLTERDDDAGNKARRTRAEILNHIANYYLDKAHMGDAGWENILVWFRKANHYGIPASSILQLACTARSPRLLLCLAFHLYAECRDEDKETLGKKLKIFSQDLAFQWYWLRSHLNGVMSLISEFITPGLQLDAMKKIYVTWAAGKGMRAAEYLAALSNPEAYEDGLYCCLEELTMSFSSWLEDLCVSSMTESYDGDPQGFEVGLAKRIVRNDMGDMPGIEERRGEGNYIENNQEQLSESTTTFFAEYSEQNRVGNVLWLLQRVNAVAAHLQGNIDLFAQPEEIRRSIIYCNKSSNTYFIRSLYERVRH